MTFRRVDHRFLIFHIFPHAEPKVLINMINSYQMSHSNKFFESFVGNHRPFFLCATLFSRSYLSDIVCMVQCSSVRFVYIFFLLSIFFCISNCSLRACLLCVFYAVLLFFLSLFSFMLLLLLLMHMCALHIVHSLTVHLWLVWWMMVHLFIYLCIFSPFSQCQHTFLSSPLLATLHAVHFQFSVNVFHSNFCLPKMILDTLCH